MTDEHRKHPFEYLQHTNFPLTGLADEKPAEPAAEQSNVINIGDHRSLDACIERVQQLCAEAADKVQEACRVLRAANCEPSQIGVQPCGFDVEVDLQAVFDALADVAGYLGASGNLHPIAAS
jgi:hypothetical protein